MYLQIILRKDKKKNRKQLQVYDIYIYLNWFFFQLKHDKMTIQGFK